MKTIKRFIVWVNYGLEGWSIFGSSDDWDEAVSIRSEAIDECNIDEEDIILAENKNELVVKPAAKQMTEWHRELEAVLMTLDDCQMECDGMTWAEATYSMKRVYLMTACMALCETNRPRTS